MQAETKVVVPGPCPCCNTDIEYLYKTENIPYFSDILIISAICPSCGYKFVDTQLLKHNEPARYTLAIHTEDDLSVRVIRSMSASIEIPELGVRIDPGPVCQGFVSNVEGVLDRIVEVVKGAFRWGTDIEKENATALLADIARVKTGTFPITLILEDPSGNSGIIADGVTKEKYVPEDE
ncbi:ZPR1 zinc finger domain-containing protein [Methanoregula sp.]|uniref:ZPR1 zinc finger domain-containing protein n=1 Tax=Methanoregula sp. TaxID=2052170 RepID=UPI00236CF121|nr:ZPR1 zinc finger domain-containing protein [Methanoregula sp.]MDD1686248.1 ZPR1 zinc finger domain-containing protein [Methanoregula sp.]